MANEATIRSSLNIRKQSGAITVIDFKGSGVDSFTATVTGTKGPVPGAIAATVVGVDVDFSELTQPGLCKVSNMDDTNYVTLGIWDPEIAKFFPLMEILPGESYSLRLSRLLGGELGTGSGTTGPDTNTMRIKSSTGTVNVIIEAFEV